MRAPGWPSRGAPTAANSASIRSYSRSRSGSGSSTRSGPDSIAPDFDGLKRRLNQRTVIGWDPLTVLALNVVRDAEDIGGVGRGRSVPVAAVGTPAVSLGGPRRRAGGDRDSSR